MSRAASQWFAMPRVARSASAALLWLAVFAIVIAFSVISIIQSGRENAAACSRLGGDFVDLGHSKLCLKKGTLLRPPAP